MTLTIERTTLKGATMMAGKKDVRCYLNGVNIRVEPGTNQVLVTSTNGHYMFEGVAETPHNSPTDFIIPIDICELLTKGKHETITFDYVDGQTWTASTGTTTTTFKAVDGKFPYFALVRVPREPARDMTDVVHYHFKYLALAQKALVEASGCNEYSVYLQSNKERGAGLIYIKPAKGKPEIEYPRAVVMGWTTTE